MSSVSATLLEGLIPPDGIVARLVEIEETCTTGVLRYQGPSGQKGEVVLFRGQIAADQPRGDAEIEELLTLKGGHFVLEQELPPLPVSGGDDVHREGSLNIHAPADLMRYCEDAGLTGVLTLERDDASAEARYVRGALEDVQVRELNTLEEVFGWDTGKFRIDADVRAEDPPALSPPAPAEPAPGEPSSGELFLRVVEVTLAAVMEDREALRPPTVQRKVEPTLTTRHRSVPAPPLPAAERDPSEHTVKIIFLSDGGDEKKKKTPAPALAPEMLETGANGAVAGPAPDASDTSSPASSPTTVPESAALEVSRRTRPLPMDSKGMPLPAHSGPSSGMGTWLFLAFAAIVFLAVVLALVMMSVD